MIVTKRSFDTMMESSPSLPTHPVCSPHRITFLDSSATKKLRSPRSNSNWSQKSSRSTNTFLNRTSDIAQEDVQNFLQRFKKPRLQGAMSDEEVETNSEPLYTQQEVNKIVSLAVRETEEKLREVYDTILNEQLAEQFENFSKFNQDFVSRKLKNSTYDYMS